jgi:DNA topoisomerase-1
MLSLIDKTGFRVGSEADTGGKVRAYGASTLTGEHVKIEGDKMHFDFIGKHGVHIEHTIEDKALAGYLRDKAGTGERLFHTSDAQARTYLKSISKDDFKTKDFRTWNGTAKAIEARNGHVAHNEREFAKLQKDVAKAVSAHLGNTPAVALQSYIDPAIWAPARGF